MDIELDDSGLIPDMDIKLKELTEDEFLYLLQKREKRNSPNPILAVLKIDHAISNKKIEAHLKRQGIDRGLIHGL